MATGPGVNQGKTAFVEEYLAGHRDADHPAINEAWTSAGNEGTVSESLVSKARSRLKLTGKRGARGGSDAGPAAKGEAKSSPKRAKGRGTPKAEETPSRSNGPEGGSGPSRSAFVEEVLRREPEANLKTVNEAWAGSGHGGAISPSIFYKIKQKMGETGELSPADQSKTEASEAGRAPAKVLQRSDVRRRATVKPARTEPADSGLSERVVDEVEAGIDDLMFTLKVNGGSPEVEEALRAARRLLTRSLGTD